MTEQTSEQKQIAQLLNQQKARLKEMLSTLEQELEAIKLRNGESLVSISEMKEQQLTAIRNADTAMNNDVNIELIKSTPELIQLKHEVVELLEQCQHQNEVCYLTAAQNQIAIEQVKSLLIGGSKNTTYNELGQKSNSGSLGKGIKA